MHNRCVDTYLVYLCFMMHRGGVDLDEYNRGITDVITMIEAERDDRPHLRAFFSDTWRVPSNNQFTMKV